MTESKVLLALAYALLLVSCQSTPPTVASVPEAPVAPEAEPTPAVATVAALDSIEPARDGFSPLAAAPANRLAFTVQWARSDIGEWEVRFVTTDGIAVRLLHGTSPTATLEWDGRDDSGAYPLSGPYKAELRSAVAGAWSDPVSSSPFLLDLVSPSGSVTVNPAAVTPGEPVTFHLSLQAGDSDWTVWRLAVFHPDGRRFRDFISEDHRSNQVDWDGRALNNATLEAGVDYRVEAEVFDLYGNRGVVTSTLSVVPAPAATPVVLTLDGQRLAELPVYFAPFSADLQAVPPAERATNEASLAALAELLKSAGQNVVVVGHANQLLYEDAVKAAVEQAEVLLPLSQARAEAVVRGLASLGVPAEALEARGRGGLDPIVPFSDTENRWKNRRVVIELQAG